MAVSVKPVATKPFPTPGQPVGVRNKIFTTVAGERLHIAVENRYAGSINSYNNWLTQSVASIFGWSEQVTINGKTRYVDKEDYIKFLSENSTYSDASVAHIKDFVDFNALKIVPTQEKGTMQQNINQDKANMLFKKLVSAMVERKDYEKAKKLIGKGADLNCHFWVRDGQGISFTNLTAGLPNKKAIDFQAGRYTPLLYAAVINNQLFTDYICFFDPDFTVQGETLKFERKIVGVNPGPTVVTTEGLKSQNGQTVTRQTVKSSTTLGMQDVTTPQYYIQFNPENRSLIWIENRERGVIENHDYSIVRYGTQLIKN